MRINTQVSETTPASRRRFSFYERAQSFAHAFRGIALVLTSQHNAWVHAGIAFIVLACGIALRISRFDWCWIVLAIAGVWVAEALNTALELLCDVASPGFHPIVKQAKDVAAGAVLIAAAAAAIIGLLVFVPYVAVLLKLIK